MMKKAIILLFAIVLFAGFAIGDSISDYNVTPNVPLNQPISATGLFLDDNGLNSNVLCSFFFFDSNQLPVDRATDEYTNSYGRFSTTGYKITEPTFERGRTYSLRTECGNTYISQNFSVGQKQEAINILGFVYYPQSVGYDLIYWMNMDNTFTMIIVIIVLGALIFLAYRIYNGN